MMPFIPGAADQRTDIPSTPAQKMRNRLDASFDGLQQKSEVNYRKADGNQRCADCTHFDGEQACDLVAGRIAPDATCDLYEQAQPEKMPDMTGATPQENPNAGYQ